MKRISCIGGGPIVRRSPLDVKWLMTAAARAFGGDVSEGHLNLTQASMDIL